MLFRSGVLAPKIQGTLALEEALAGIQLDFLVLVSSIAAFTGGGPGQIEYCAANSFLDAYARRNFHRNGITVAINFGEWQWDAWGEGLLGYPPEVREAFIAIRKKFGIGFEEGMEAIHRVLSADVAQWVVVTQNFIPMVEGSNECTAAKLTEEVNKTRKQQQRSYPRPALGTSFVAAGNQLERKIAEIWQRVLGIENIGVQDNFFDLGGNSLVGLQVIADLKRELEADITPIALYEAPTVSAFARYLNPDVDLQPSAAQEMVATRREQVRQTRGTHEIAVIGMAGRFPGAKNVREFWQNISSGVESVRFYSDAELMAAGADRAELKNPNYVKAGGDLDDIDLFDALLFGYAPREAESIDPQHRFFLECAWEALEDAGYDAERYAGLIGVFGGANSSKYQANIMSRPDLLSSGVARWQAGVGNTNDSLATRVSYKLNLRGPSLSVQTFCSTSGVAAHMACQSLLAGESDIALAGGVNISVPNKTGYLYEEGSIDSPDGHTRTFDAQAKGSMIGNGVGIVVLKRLEEAVSDGDHIYAVIKGSAINNDGSVKVGYTAPSVDGQCAAILDALSVAGVEAETISYVEAHGTATELGDPIEVAALSKAYGNGSERVGYCAIGSVKTNVGHLDRAAGVTALIKTALALQHEFLPAILHFREANPNIDFAHSPFFVCTQAGEWTKKNGEVRRAGVNVVGLGGTNVHLVLEEAPERAASGPSRSAQMLLLSAKTEGSLDAATANLWAYLEQNPEVNLADVAYTLQVGRKKLEHRRALVCGDRGDAIAALKGKGNDGQRVISYVQAAGKKSVVFLFPGVGDHYVNMAGDLYREEAEFREQVDRCCELLQPELGLDLRSVLFSKEGSKEGSGEAGGKGGVDVRALLARSGPGDQPVDQLHQTWLAQPAVFVIEYCLARLLMSWGIVPEALIGYSLGEYVAAVIAGVMSLQDGLRVVAGRARLIDQLPCGAMLAVPLAEQEVVPLLGEKLFLAVCNSPKLTVVSGTEEAIAELEVTLQQKEMVSRRLQTRHAFHSPMMEAAYGEFVKLLQTVELKEPRMAYLSNLTGSWIKAEEARDVHYWARHMCQTVRFSAGVEELLQDRDRVFVEVGAGQTLGSLIKQQPGYGGAGAQVIVSTLSAVYQKQPDLGFLLAGVGKLWLAGVQLEWSGFYARERRLRLSLPTYCFERQRYWVEPGEGPVVASKAVAGKNPDIAEWFYRPTWRESKLPARLRSQTSAGVNSYCLLFLDPKGVGWSLARQLEEAGQGVVRVRAGAEFRKLEQAEGYEIRPGVPEDYDRLIQQLKAEDKLPARIGHLWSATPAQPGEQADDFGKWQELGYYSLLYTMQALAKCLVLEPLEVVVVSSNMQAVSGDEVLCPAKATLLGPCKGIPQESPHIICRSVDMQWPAEDGGEMLVSQLAEELLSESSDLVVAYRKGARLVQDFEPVRVEALAEGESRLRPGGVYLITGGLGGVGMILARHLARKVQARLVLMGRSGVPERGSWTEWLEEHGEEDATSQKIRKVQNLEELGAQVRIMAGDVSNPQQMARAVESAYENFGALHGVVHAAGISEGWAFRIVQEVGRKDSEYQFQPKVYGLMALEKALAGKELDFCLLTSSLSSILGGMKLVPYAAANIFMDAFTQRHNQTATLPWISINWDTWRLKAGQHGTLGKTVAEFEMSPEEGCEAFERLIYRRPGSQVVESTGDLETRIDQWIRRQSLRSAADSLSQKKTTLYARPHLQTAYIPTSNDVEEKIAHIWQQVLGIENVGIHDNYFDLGGTSLSALQVIAQLQKEFSVPVSPIVLFEASTVSELSKRLQPNRGKADNETLKKAVARRRAGRQTRQANSEIAIVGMAGRFPGANNIAEFWRNIRDGIESVHRLSDEELKQAGVPSELFSNPNYVKARPIMAHTDMFDASFFNYSPREAEFTDPQHRVLLEIAWEALESAGYDSQRYDGRIGVFAGSNSSHYAARIMADPEAAASFDRPEIALANDRDSLTTAISYKLNLRGPSLCVQTSCSTSLVATHLACQSILAGECEMALGGGISLRVPQKSGYLYENNGQDSPDGHSRTFDAKANGTVFGEGAGMVLLKRLDDALADGDSIHAVIKGSAINNDGSLKAGYAAPSIDGQAEVMMMALANAAVDASTVHYVEASGTASELGDPIEVASLTKAFRAFTDAKNYCAIGSVKPNIGHPDRAAGVIGLIKTVETLKHKMIPPNLFFETPNPYIDFENSPFFVNTKLAEWNRNGTPRRAGVNSVGTGGTNAHVIVEEAPAQPPSGPSRSWKLMLLSARTSSALEKVTANLCDYLESNPDSNLADIAFTLQVGRRRFAHRRAFLCQDHEDAKAGLQGRKSVGSLTHYEERRNRSTAFLFPDAGDHYDGMASGLYLAEAEFREEVDRCCNLLNPILGVDLRETVFSAPEKDAHRIKSGDGVGPPGSSNHYNQVNRPHHDQVQAENQVHRCYLSHPAVFVTEYALARLLMSWGIIPQGQIGYGVGEFVAAVLAGSLSLEDALRLVCARAKLIDRLASDTCLEPPLAPPIPRPDSEEFVQLLRFVDMKAPQIPYISNVTGTWITAEEVADPQHWTRQRRQTSCSDGALESLFQRKDALVLEVGPGRAISSRTRPRWNGEGSKSCSVLPALKSHEEQQSDEAFLLTTLAKLWLSGVEVDWSGFHSGEERRRVPLPTYPFERQRYWIDIDGQSRRVGKSKQTTDPGRKEPDISDWFYVPGWKQSAPRISQDRGIKGAAGLRWLVLADDSPLVVRIVSELKLRSENVTCVSKGDAFSREGTGSYVINPRIRDHYDLLFSELSLEGHLPNRIVHLWALNPLEVNRAASERVDTITEHGMIPLLHLSCALAGKNSEKTYRKSVV